MAYSENDFISNFLAGSLCETEADHMRYEENARYDAYDGRDEYDYCGDQADLDPFCPDCRDGVFCAACAAAKADYDALMDAEGEAADLASADHADVPF